MNAGLSNGLIDPKHQEAMGEALWLFVWLVASQTRRNGLVLGGKPLTYAEMSRRMHDMPARRLKRWMAVLVKHKYIQVKYATYKRMVITVLNQKKFNKQKPLDFSKGPQTVHTPTDIKTENGPLIAPQTVPRHTINGLSNKSSNESLSSAEKPDKGGALSVGCQDLQIPLALWQEYKQLRERLHRPIIPGSEHHILAELRELKARGLVPAEVLIQAIRTSSWKLGPSPNGNHKGGAREREERNREAAREALSRYGH